MAHNPLSDDPLRDAAPDLLAALKSAAASIQMQAATARHMAEVQDRDANLRFAQELERNAAYYADVIAKAEAGKAEG